MTERLIDTKAALINALEQAEESVEAGKRVNVSVYEDLPRSMGFRKRKTSASLPELPEVWHVVPNRRR